MCFAVLTLSIQHRQSVSCVVIAEHQSAPPTRSHELDCWIPSHVAEYLTEPLLRSVTHGCAWQFWENSIRKISAVLWIAYSLEVVNEFQSVTYRDCPANLFNIACFEEWVDCSLQCSAKWTNFQDGILAHNTALKMLAGERWWVRFMCNFCCKYWSDAYLQQDVLFPYGGLIKGNVHVAPIRCTPRVTLEIPQLELPTM